MIKLKEIFDEIKNDRNIDGLDINEQIDIQTYYLLVETMDTKNVYSYESTDKFFAGFTDQNGINHFIRITYQPLVTIPNAYVLKMWFTDLDGKVSYERPNVIFNLKADEKIFNTYVHIVIDDFLDKFFQKVPTGTRLYLPATDYSRYRLYRMALNKFLDKTKYKLNDFSDVKNCLVIDKV
jgi:hypothetical protein